MNRDLTRFFRGVEPPPGGVERFRERLEGFDDVPRSPLRYYVAVAAAVLVLAIVAVGVMQRPDDTPLRDTSLYQAQEFDRLLGRPKERANLRVSVNDKAVTVSERRTENSKIRMYEIERD